jgi:hypothetical protein
VIDCQSSFSNTRDGRKLQNIGDYSAPEKKDEKSRSNHRPRRGAHRLRPENSGVAHSAARRLHFFSHSHFSLFSRESFVKKKKKKKKSRKLVTTFC